MNVKHVVMKILKEVFTMSTVRGPVTPTGLSPLFSSQKEYVIMQIYGIDCHNSSSRG